MRRSDARKRTDPSDQQPRYPQPNHTDPVVEARRLAVAVPAAARR